MVQLFTQIPLWILTFRGHCFEHVKLWDTHQANTNSSCGCFNIHLFVLYSCLIHSFSFTVGLSLFYFVGYFRAIIRNLVNKAGIMVVIKWHLKIYQKAIVVLEKKLGVLLKEGDSNTNVKQNCKSIY